MSKPREAVQQKQCSRCRQLKDASEFYARPASRDGLHSHCRDCHNELSRDWIARNKDKIRAYSASHRAELSERSRRWIAANPERVRARQRQYYAEHREELLAKAREKHAKKKQESG